MRLASPRHYNDLASSSQRSYGYDFRDYQRRREEAGLPVYARDDEWLQAYLEEESRKSIGRVLSRLAAIAYGFWKQGLPDPTLDLPIRRTIHEFRVREQEARKALLGIVPRGAKPFAQRCVDGAYSESYTTVNNQRWAAWELWAARHGIDPRQPEPIEFARYVQTFGAFSYPSVRNVVSGLRVCFRSRGLPDVTGAREVQDVLETIRRNSRDPSQPLFVADVRTIVAGFGADRLDKRDRLHTLFVSFGGLNPTLQSELMVEDTHVESCANEDGSTTRWLHVTARGHEILIDGYPDEPALDVVEAYETYRASVAWNAGPLFRSLGLRGEYLARMSPGAIASAISHATRRAGFQVRSPVRSLLRGFELQAVKCLGTIITARYLGKSTHALERASPTARIEAEQVRRGHRGRRRRRHRGHDLRRGS